MTEIVTEKEYKRAKQMIKESNDIIDRYNKNISYTRAAETVGKYMWVDGRFTNNIRMNGNSLSCNIVLYDKCDILFYSNLYMSNDEAKDILENQISKDLFYSKLNKVCKEHNVSLIEEL